VAAARWGRGGRDHPGQHGAGHHRTGPYAATDATRGRLVSVFRQGWIRILVALLHQAPLPIGRFIPEPWPVVPVPEQEDILLPDIEMLQAA